MTSKSRVVILCVVVLTFVVVIWKANTPARVKNGIASDREMVEELRCDNVIPSCFVYSKCAHGQRTCLACDEGSVRRESECIVLRSNTTRLLLRESVCGFNAGNDPICMCADGFDGTGTPTCTELPPCPVSTPLVGVWKRGPRDFNITFESRQEGPFMEDCAHRSRDWEHDTVDFYSAYDPFAADDVFVPRGCRLVDPRPSDYSWAVGRKFVFMGDSLSFNHYFAQTREWDACWNTTGYGDDDGGYICRGFEPDRDAPSKKVRLCYVPAGASRVPFVEALASSIEKLKLGRRDVIVMNEGLHDLQGLAQRSRENADALRTTYAKLGDKAPLMLWRESFPQHFNTPTGEYDHKAPVHPCVPHVRTENVVNHASTRYIATVADQPILYVFDRTAERAMEHIGYSMMKHSTGEPTVPYVDCTHYCVPSSPLRFATRMMAHHIVLLRP